MAKDDRQTQILSPKPEKPSHAKQHAFEQCGLFMSLPAAGESAAPLASSFWRMKASIGFRTWAALRTRGAGEAFGGRKDQNWRSLLVTNGSAAVPAMSGSSATSGPPCAIQLASLSISEALIGFTPALSRPAFGGIVPARSFWIARLSSGFARTMAGPDLPTFRSEASCAHPSPLRAFAPRGKSCSATGVAG